MTEQNKDKPIKDFRSGGIQAGVWRNEVQKDGNTTVRYSVKIQKRFKNKKAEYENTNYYFRDDLPKLILVANKAFEYISLTESKDAEETVPI
jgi:hypothetical protein